MKKALYVHVCCNLYLLIIPNKKKNDTSIEDLFDDSVLSVKLGGKSFTTENDYSNEKFYGKNIFATAVVEKKKETIDFSGFNVIFNVIEAIKKDYLKLYNQQQIKRLNARLKKA